MQIGVMDPQVMLGNDVVILRESLIPRKDEDINALELSKNDCLLYGLELLLNWKDNDLVIA